MSAASLLFDAISGRRERRAERRSQRAARHEARSTTPMAIAPRVSTGYYARIAHFGPGRDPRQAGYVFGLRSDNFATAAAHFKDLRGWDEVAAMRGAIHYPEVKVYEFWDATSGRPRLVERWDTTMIDLAERRQWLAMNQGG